MTLLPEVTTDETIMTKVAQGSISDLSVLFDRYQVKLFNFFWKLTQDRTVSQDLTQTLFYRVLKYRGSYRAEEGSFKSWVYGMARNIHLDFCKQQNRVVGQVRPVGTEHDSIPGGVETYNESRLERLDKALLGLVPDDREIIVLSRYQGLKYEDIARIKGLSVPAIKVRVHRAMKVLKNLYLKQADDEPGM